MGLNDAETGNLCSLIRHCGLPTRPRPAVNCTKILLPYACTPCARSRQPENTVRLRSMRGKYDSPPSSLTEGSMPWLMGMSPVVINPTPPLARAKKYCSIFSFGRPVSSHMSMLPIGAITSRFFTFNRLICTGANIASYGYRFWVMRAVPPAQFSAFSHTQLP